jgi:hypothetical protein
MTLILLSGAFFIKNISLHKQLGNERIKSEKLLSEKLKLDKSIEKFRNDLAALMGQNVRLDKLVTKANKKLQNKEAEIKRLMAENATVDELRAKNSELEAMREKLINDISDLNLSMNQLKTENSQLNDLLASIRSENEILIVDNTILKAMVADNYRAEALKGKNDKLTVNARKTDKLMVSFDLPSDAGDNLYFKVITPKGDEFSSKTDLSARIFVVENNERLLASASDNVVGSIGTKRVEMIYTPNIRLTKGVYKFNLYNDKNYIGSTQLRLK